MVNRKNKTRKQGSCLKSGVRRRKKRRRVRFLNSIIYAYAPKKFPLISHYALEGGKSKIFKIDDFSALTSKNSAKYSIVSYFPLFWGGGGSCLPTNPPMNLKHPRSDPDQNLMIKFPLMIG